MSVTNTGNKQFHIFSFSSAQVCPALPAALLPPLSHAAHKGSLGRVGVLGGSQEYTGAPFYAGLAALRCGADLASVFCSLSAAPPIKGYSPELMVTPFYEDQEMQFFSIADINGDNAVWKESCAEKRALQEREYNERIEHVISEAVRKVVTALPRIHVLVVGPGLGRNPLVGRAAAEIMRHARKHNVFLVIDADGLWALSEHHDVIHGYTRCIITPNAVEFSRLTETMRSHCQQKINTSHTEELKTHYENLLNELASFEDAKKTRALSLALGGVTVLRKGEQDVISAGADVFVLRDKGSPRRCGGQGDILAGCLAVAAHWQQMRANELIAYDITSTLREEAETRETLIDLQEASELEEDVAADVRLLVTKAPTLVGGARAGLSAVPQLTPTSAGRQRLGNILAAILSAATVKRAAQLAFASKKRSMTAPDVLDQIGVALDELEHLDTV